MSLSPTFSQSPVDAPGGGFDDGSVTEARRALDRARLALVQHFAHHPSWLALCLLEAPDQPGGPSSNAGKELQRTILLAELGSVPAFAAFQRVGQALVVLDQDTHDRPGGASRPFAPLGADSSIAHQDGTRAGVAKSSPLQAMDGGAETSHGRRDDEFARIISRIRTASSSPRMPTDGHVWREAIAGDDRRPRLSFTPASSRVAVDGAGRPADPGPAVVVSEPECRAGDQTDGVMADGGVRDHPTVAAPIDLKPATAASRPVHTELADRLNALESELDTLAQRPSGAQSLPPSWRAVPAPIVSSGGEGALRSVVAPVPVATSGSALFELSPRAPSPLALGERPPRREAEIEIVSTPIVARRAAPVSQPAPAASAAPCLNAFDGEEATISIVAAR